MNNKNILKVALIFGGGFLAFLLLKPNITGGKKSLEGLTPQPKEDSGKREISEKEFQNAEIVANAYTDALKAGESVESLTELNKELMKEFNMRCYLDKSNSIVVCDSKGTTILTK
jgi:hypothetical protein